jgi:hypothetical protein
MTPEIQEKHKVILAQLIRQERAMLPAFVEMRQLEAKKARITFEAYTKAGFNEEQAMRLLVLKGAS